MDRVLREELFRGIEEVEAATEKVVGAQEKCKMYEMNRRKSQEAINHLKISTTPNRVWACLSHQFFKLSRDSLKEALHSDVKTLSGEIEILRKELKCDLEQLRKLEGKDPLKGFNLIPLSNDELSGVTGIY